MTNQGNVEYSFSPNKFSKMHDLGEKNGGGNSRNDFPNKPEHFLIPRYNDGVAERRPSPEIKGAVGRFMDSLEGGEAEKIQKNIAGACKDLFTLNDGEGSNGEPISLKIERLSRWMIEQISKDPELSAEKFNMALENPVLIAKWSLGDIKKIGLTADTVSDEISEVNDKNTRTHGEFAREAFNTTFLKILDEKLQVLLAERGLPKGIKCAYYFGSGLGIYLCHSENDEEKSDFYIARSQRSHERALPKKE